MGKETKDSVDLLRLLREKFPLPKFAFATEVPNGTTWHKTNTIDALAVGCWSSAGLQIIGFEIKDYRSDWQREMQLPGKAHAWKQHCHDWYLVAQKGVAKLEELPPSWGLMEPAGASLKIRKVAERNDSPAPITTNLLAAIMRALQSTSASERDIKAAYKRGSDDANKQADVTVANKTRHLQRQLDDLKGREHSLLEKIKAFV